MRNAFDTNVKEAGTLEVNEMPMLVLYRKGDAPVGFAAESVEVGVLESQRIGVDFSNDKYSSRITIPIKVMESAINQWLELEVAEIVDGKIKITGNMRADA